MKVILDTSPLQNENAIRGIGVYTRCLRQELLTIQDENFSLVESNRDADILHYPFFDLFFPTLPFHINSSKKIVVTIHDVIPLLFPEHYPVGLRGNLNFFTQKIALSFTDAILTDSIASKNDICRYLQIPFEKVHVVYLAGNPDVKPMDQSDQKIIREKFNLPKKFILYVGDINYNKNIPALIEALQLIPPDISLVCVGKNFKAQNIPEWLSIQSKLNTVADRVVMLSSLGKDSTNELSTIYSAAEAYVQPSLAEGFGLPVLEAMQAGTLVVNTKNTSLIEISGDVTELVNEDPVSIASGINNVLHLSQSQRTERKRLAKTWVQQFTWRKTATETLAVYKNVFNGSKL